MTATLPQSQAEPTPTETLSFPPFRVNLVNEQLWRGAELLPLRPKSFAVLRYLLTHAGQLVTKAALLQVIWPDTIGNAGLPKGCIRELRQVLGDKAETPRFIETVGRRGYRFIGKLTPEASGARGQDRGRHRAPLSAGEVSPLPPFVGRDAELERLRGWLERATHGQRHCGFVTGEPGIGKTALVDVFCRRVQREGRAWVGRGQCVEHYGAGEAYGPVLEALGRLGRDHGDRLVPLLYHHAPTWLLQLPMLLRDADLEALQRRAAGTTQERMLRELTAALEVLTQEQPLILVLEDLQWSDVSTLDWLAAVAQRREPARLLLLGTYRPVDVIMRNHPLKAVKQELQLRRHCEEVPLRFLTAAEVSQYLTARFPRHRFPAALGPVLHHSTEGNPLFLVNVVDDFVTRGWIRTVEGQWAVQEPLAALAGSVPDSLRQLIEQQLERLAPEERRILEVASVAGAEFSTAAVALSLEADRERIEQECEGLARRGQWLHFSGLEPLPDGSVASRYGFTHGLYQQVVYERLAAAQRVRWHRRMGESGEQMYGAQGLESAAALAFHFEWGQDYERAVQYCGRAGQQALEQSAHHEARAHLTKGLALLQAWPATPARVQQELTLQLTLGAALQATLGYSAPEVEHAYARARALCEQTGDTPQLFPALWGLWVFAVARAELQTAQELSEQLLRLAHRTQDAVWLLEAHRALGETLLWRGKVIPARAALEQGLALYDPGQQQAYAALYDLNDPRVLCLSRAALALGVLGYLDQALTRSAEALALAQQRTAPFSVAMAHNFTALVHYLRREEQAVQEHAEAAITLATEYGFRQWLAWGTVLRGWALATQAGPSQSPGQRAEGVAQLSQGLAAWQATGAGLGRPYHLALLAETYGEGGQREEGLAVLTEALATVTTSGERVAAAELYRLQGELLLQSSGPRREATGRRVERAAEACFQQAIESARCQGAKWWELRATVSLARLWLQQGKATEARQRLAEIYSWFTEGLDTKGLQEARALLEELK